jgi:hypothetical protein
MAKLLCPNKSAISPNAAPFIRSQLANVAASRASESSLSPLHSQRFRTSAPVFERFPGLLRLEHTPSPIAPVMHNPQGGNRSIIQRDVYRFFAFRPRDVQRPTTKVYHVPRQVVLIPLPQTCVDRRVQLGKVRRPLGLDDPS